MSVTNHERPGVYSRYDASTVVKGRGGTSRQQHAVCIYERTSGLATLSEIIAKIPIDRKSVV